MNKYQLAAVIAAFCTFAAVAQDVEQPIPAEEKVRIARVAAQARDDKEITEEQYQKTMSYLRSHPCRGVSRSLSDAEKEVLATAIAKEERVESVELLGSYSFRKWRIIEIDNHVSDEPYLFYADDPVSAKPVAAWSGAATIFETSDMEQWVYKSVSGIPPKLANCFAWHVTLNRR